MFDDKKENKPIKEFTIADIIEDESDKKILEPVEKPVETKKSNIGYVMADRLFLRKETDLGSEIVAFLKKGDTIYIDWNKSTSTLYYATAYGAMGYVPVENISIK